MDYHKRVTMKDIAKEVGITPAAVGRALNDSPDISKEMKKKVHYVAKRLGYTVNYHASALRSGKSNTLCILVPDNSNPYNARLIKGIEETAKQNGYIVFVINTNENPDTEKEAIQTACSLQVAGILAVPVKPSNYRGVNTPFVLMARSFDDEDFEDFNYVINNDQKIMELGIEHLAKQFDRKIYFINGPHDFAPAITRLHAFKKNLASIGLEYSDDLVIFDDNTSEGGYRSFRTLVEHIKPPVSIICCSDYIAIGVLKAVRDSGYSVPGDVSIVGCDDIEMLNYLEIPLTSVRQARYTIGERAAQYIFNIISNKGKYKELLRSVLQPELIVRESTGYPQKKV